MDNYDDMKKSGNLESSLARLQANLSASKHTTTFNEEAYKNLLEKYEEALTLIEVMKSKIDDLQKNRMPSKDEVESMSAMIDLLSKLDDGTINKITKLGQK